MPELELWDPVIAAAVRQQLTPFVEEEVPEVKRESNLKRIAKAFEDLGGQERFTYEMNQNYLFFLKNFFLRLVPNHAEVRHTGEMTISIRPALPPSTLDGEFYERPLDSGGDQAPGGTAPRIGSAPRADDPAGENGEGPQLQECEDAEAGSSS